MRTFQQRSPARSADFRANGSVNFAGVVHSSAYLAQTRPKAAQVKQCETAVAAGPLGEECTRSSSFLLGGAVPVTS